MDERREREGELERAREMLERDDPRPEPDPPDEPSLERVREALRAHDRTRPEQPDR